MATHFLSRHPILTKLLLLAASLGVVLLLVEAGLRVAGCSAPIFRKVDPELGWKLCPRMEGWNLQENRNHVRINSLGFHDREHSVSKPANTIRIAVLGDSFTQATEVPIQKNFCSRLDAKLDVMVQPLGRQADVMNFGVVGYGATQQLLTLRKTVWEYQPDIVVLAMYLGNDIADNTRSLAESLNDLRPYFGLENGALSHEPQLPSPDAIRKSALTLEVINHSRLLQLLKEAMLRRHAWRRADESAPLRRPSEADNVFLNPPNAKWSEAWTLTEQLVLTIHDEVRKHGAEFLVVTINDPIRIHPDRKVRDEFVRKLGVRNLDYPDERIAALAKENGISVLPLAAPMADHASTQQAWLHGFSTANRGQGHWNDAGHDLAASLIASALKPLVLAR